MTGTRLRAVAVLLALLAAGCDEGGPAPRTGPLQVVTTVAPITSIASEVGGDRVRVVGTAPESGATSVPATTRLLSQADLVLANGLAVDDPTVALARAFTPTTSRVVQLGAAALRDAGRPLRPAPDDVRLWTDPVWAAKYADLVRDALVAQDPGGTSTYVANHRDFVRRATELAVALRHDEAALPPARRLLMTSRGGYRQLARAHHWTVLDAAPLPGEARAATVARLVALVRARGVAAVFPLPDDDLLAEVGTTAGVRLDTSLRDVDLPGGPGDPEHSWLGLMRADYRAMLRGFGAPTPALDALVVDDPTPDTADYPQ